MKLNVMYNELNCLQEVPKKSVPLVQFVRVYDSKNYLVKNTLKGQNRSLQHYQLVHDASKV